MPGTQKKKKVQLLAAQAVDDEKDIVPNDNDSSSSDDDDYFDDEEAISFDPAAAGSDDTSHEGGKKRKRGDDTKQEIIDVEFNYFDPRPTDFHTLKLFFKDYVAGNDNFPTSELADLVAGQVSVGTMIKNEAGEEQPLAFISAINIHRHKDKKCIKQIKRYLLTNAGSSENKAQLRKLFADRQTGLLLQDRLINLPDSLVPELHHALVQDIEWAVVDKQETPEIRKSFDFKNFILLGKGYYPKKSNKRMKTTDAKASAPAMEYFRFEEEYYRQVASFSHVFRVPSSGQSEIARLDQTRVLMAFPRAKLTEVAGRLLSMDLKDDE